MSKSAKVRRQSRTGASGKRGAARAPMPGQVGWSFDGTPSSYVVREPSLPESEIHEGWMCRAYLHARTVLCPSCTGLIPLSPNWRLSKDLGIRLKPLMDYLVCDYEVVPKSQESEGTVNKAIAVCPFCGTATPKGYLHTEAQAKDIPGQPLTRSQIYHLREEMGIRSDGLYLGRMGDVEYCHIKNYWYAIYRQGQPPMQGKTPLLFEVPGTVIWHSWIVRRGSLLLCQDDRYAVAEANEPSSLDLGLYGGTPSQYAPGLERLARHHGFASVDDLTDIQPREEDMGVQADAIGAYYDPPTKRQPSRAKES